MELTESRNLRASVPGATLIPDLVRLNPRASDLRHLRRFSYQRARMALVVFLRGCNVGGHKAFRPTRLAAQLRHHDVVNIGAAGTFVARKPISRATLLADLRHRLPFDADVMICE